MKIWVKTRNDLVFILIPQLKGVLHNLGNVIASPDLAYRRTGSTGRSNLKFGIIYLRKDCFASFHFARNDCKHLYNRH
jgi:hypothetical protein